MVAFVGGLRRFQIALEAGVGLLSAGSVTRLNGGGQALKIRVGLAVFAEGLARG